MTVQVSLEESIEVLKWQLLSLTDMAPEKQKLVGFGIEFANDGDKLSSITGLKEGSVLSLVGLELEKEQLMGRIKSNAR